MKKEDRRPPGRKRAIPGLDDQGRKQCPHCEEWKELEKFPFQRGRAYDRGSWCSACLNNRQKARYKLDYYQDLYLKRRYGITALQYNEMLEKQNGVCAVCKQPEKQKPGRRRPDTEATRLNVDHCHKTGKVRGLLYNACNVALGSLDDEPERIKALLSYIETYAS